MKNIFFVYSLLLIINSNGAIGQITFQKKFSLYAINVYSVDTIPENLGYIISGNKHTPQVSYNYLLKTDIAGDLEWYQEYDNPIGYRCTAGNTADGGFYLLSSSFDSLLNKPILTLVKTDSNGTVLWAKSYAYMLVPEIHGFIKQTMDSGFILSSEWGTIIKTNSLGDTLWTRIIENIQISSIFQSKDSSFMITGTLFTQSPNYYGLLFKLDPRGNLLWAKTFKDGNSIQGLGNIIESENGDYTFFGTTNINPKLYLLKINSNGDTLFTKSILSSAYTRCSKIVQDMDSGYSIFSRVNNSDSSILIKTDPVGNILWSRVYDNVSSIDIQKTSDSGYVFVGYNPTGFSLVKTDVNGISGCNEYLISLATDTTTIEIANTILTISSGCILNNAYVTSFDDTPTVTTLCSSIGIFENLKLHSFVVSPNPTLGKIEIECDDSKIESVEIFNLLGEIIFTDTEIKSSQLIVDCRLFQRGIYFVRVQTENGNAVQKLIKE